MEMGNGKWKLKCNASRLTPLSTQRSTFALQLLCLTFTLSCETRRMRNFCLFSHTNAARNPLTISTHSSLLFIYICICLK